MVGSGFTILDILKDASEAIGVVPVLKPIFASVAGVLQAVQQTQVNFNEMKDLAFTAGDFALRLAETCSTSPTVPSEVEHLIQRFNRQLRQIAERCEALSRKPWSICFLQNSIHKEELSGLKTQLDAAVQQFQNSNLITLQASIQHVVVQLDQMKLETLPKRGDISGTRAEYMADSRNVDVEKICERLFDAAQLVVWIEGPAGVGKSTLVGHLSGQLRSAGLLAASLFLGAFPTDNVGPETIIKMLSHEVGKNHPKAISKIVEAINKCNELPLQDHMEHYILEPIRSLAHPHPLIVIVDAVDEWKSHPSFIKTLVHLSSETSTVKFIITSRSKPSSSRLPDLDKISVHTYPLLPVSTDIMKSYFDKYFATVPWVDGRKATTADVNKLADLSGGLPVWASTVISLLSEQFSESPPHEILSGILASQREVGSSDGLVELYRNAILRLFPSSEAQRYFRLYLGAVLVLQEALPLSEFSKLVGMPPHLVKNTHSALSAIQTRSPHGSENTVHPASTRFHLSFLEYVQATPAENAFAISAFGCHSAVGLTCLDQIVTLPPVSSKQTPGFSFHSLQGYAVKYWPFHVSHGTNRSQDEWVKTQHCSTLQAIPIGAQQRWAALFLNVLFPKAEKIMVIEEQSITSILMKLGDNLNKDSGDHWAYAVACLEVAVRLGSGCDDAWYKLGQCHYQMGYRTGSSKMFEEAVSAFRRALELRPAPHPDRSSTLAYLGDALWSFRDGDGDIDALNEGIQHHRDALALRPPPHPDRPASLLGLGGALQTLYESNGDIDALNEGISHLRDALALLPAPNRNRFAYLNNLGGALQTLYERNGDINALNEGISHLRNALAFLPAHHPDRFGSLNNLGYALRILYMRDGDINTLNEGISHLRDTLALLPAPHPNRGMSLNNLGGALYTLYERNRDIDFLNESILHHRDALALRPVPHPNRGVSLNNLGSSLKTLYEHNGDINTLNESISHLRDALLLQPLSHPHRPSSLDNLAAALLSQYRQNGEIGILNEAIVLRQELLVLHPPGHRYRTSYVNCLVELLEIRIALTGEEADHDEIQALRLELEEYETRENNESGMEDNIGKEDSNAEKL
ncbi:hypothetical protein EST38_g9799 [Candolleomyces aberdarensis]|uniref:Nephrocystin 3-like N-terminal domain-containing protein n=1 Tax=Candolleomyces aberdarensis TaxID=2316362 RepID=A0A4Q2DCA9_9AGAR|nr:hypothetical protein EST38_g9799 [Candolleomyces aberdarensis]